MSPWLRRVTGLDFHILATLLFRGWSILAGGLTALLIPLFLGPLQQGYYYTFGAVVATQVFFELGLNHVLTQLTSHAAAHLTSGTYVDARWQCAIVSLLNASKRWNGLLAIAFFATLLAGGSYFFASQGTLATPDWLLPWIALSVAASLNLAMSAHLAICEGLGEIGRVARLRLLQSAIGYTLLWALLLTGQGLWSAPAVPLVSAALTFWWLRHQPRLKELRAAAVAHAADDGKHYRWRTDVFPLQWRIAVSWASGYFIFNFLTPVVFAHQGPVGAGQLGLAMTIFSAISSVGFSWISAKIPAFAGHIARAERTELNALFDGLLIRSVLATAVLVVAFMLFAHIAGLIGSRMVARLPPTSALLCLATATIVNTLIFGMAAYLRAHNEEPLMVQSMVTAILIGGGITLAAAHGLTATVATYAGIMLLVSLPWCWMTYRTYRLRKE